MRILIILLVCIAAVCPQSDDDDAPDTLVVETSSGDSCTPPNQAPWPYLTYKYGDGSDPQFYQKMPTFTLQATNDGWAQLPSDNLTECSNTDDGFYGFRYILKNDCTVAALYDFCGLLSGIQLMIPVSSFNCPKCPENGDNIAANPYFSLTTCADKPHYMLTVYFVDPSVVCVEDCSCPVGRDYNTIGIGNGRWIQDSNSSDGSGFTNIPLDSASLMESGWDKSADISGMGQFFIYQKSSWIKSGCGSSAPYVMLQDRKTNCSHGGVMMAIGANSSNADAFLPSSLLQTAMSPNPPFCVKSFQDCCGLTTLHYWTDSNVKMYTAGS